MAEKPLVTVLVWTYNHAKYIRDALDGILMQETDFPYDCFIFDDASTDGTSDILIEYECKYPEKIHTYISPINTYGRVDARELRSSIEEKNIAGKYVAICEGDDYWIDKEKLQNQVSFMENHLDVSFSTHSSVWKTFKTGQEEEHVLYDEDCYVPLADFFMLRDTAPSTASIVVRKDVFISWRKNEDYPRTSIGDFPLMLYSLLSGKCYYFSRIMSVYRYQIDSSWSSRTRKGAYAAFSVDYLRFFRDWDKYTDYKYTEYVRIFSNQQLITTIRRLREELQNDQAVLDCIRRLYSSHKAYKNYICALEATFEVICGEDGLNDDDIKLICEKEHIVIFGLGKYSSIVEGLIYKKKVKAEGYVVSREESNMHDDKPVWNFENYPYDWNKTIVIAGVSYTWKNEIESLFKELKIDYIAPLWKDHCNWLKKST